MKVGGIVVSCTKVKQSIGESFTYEGVLRLGVAPKTRGAGVRVAGGIHPHPLPRPWLLPPLAQAHCWGQPCSSSSILPRSQQLGRCTWSATRRGGNLRRSSRLWTLWAFLRERAEKQWTNTVTKGKPAKQQCKNAWMMRSNVYTYRSCWI